MSKLRQPISGADAAASVFAVAALIVSQYWLGVVPNWTTWLVVVAIVQFVIQPLSTLLHELGHAGAVAMIASRQSFVIVGRGPWLTVTRGRVVVHFSVLATRGVRIAGVCRFDRSGLSWKQLGWIALAGPLATSAQLLLVLAMAPILWTHGPTIRYLVVLWTIGLASSLVINLVPHGPGNPATTRQSRNATAHKPAQRSPVTRSEPHRHSRSAPPQVISKMSSRRTGRPGTRRSDAYSKPSYDERYSLPGQETIPTSAVASKLSYALR